MQVDNSTLRTYCDCNVKAMISNVLHRQPKVEGEAAWFGNQFHRFVQYYWQPGDKWKDIALEYENRLAQFLNNQAANGRTYENETINGAVYLNCLKQFVAQIPRVINDNGEVILLEEKNHHPIYKVRHRPEIGFKFPLGPDEYAGRLDCLLEDFNGNLWIGDVKTTGRYTRNKQTGEAEVQQGWLTQFRHSTQFSGYIRAMQYHTQQPIAGALVFAVPRVKDKLKISHIPVRRTQAQLDKWEKSTKALIERYRDDAEYFEYRNGKIDDWLAKGLQQIIPTGFYNGACTRFGTCGYLDICLSNFNPAIIEHSTVEREWNPLHEEEE